MNIIEACNKLIAKLNLPVARDVRHNNLSDEATVRRRKFMNAKLVRFLHENDYHREFNGHELMYLVHESNTLRPGIDFETEEEAFQMSDIVTKQTDPRKAHKNALSYLILWFTGPGGLDHSDRAFDSEVKPCYGQRGRDGETFTSYTMKDSWYDMLEKSEGQRRHGS